MAHQFRGRYTLPQASEFRTRKDWANLPILKFRNEIATTIFSNQVSVIRGFTGCGKSTQIPQYIAEFCRERKEYFNIAIAQPRRFAAKSLAERVANEIGCSLGDYVGYHVGLDNNQNSGETKILYCTTGILLQNFIMSPSSIRFSHILIDEVHERSAELDMLLLALKKRLLEQTDFEVTIVLMSATFDYETICDYFVYPRITEFYPEPVNVKPALFDITSCLTQEQYLFQRDTYYLEDIIKKLEINSFNYGIENSIDTNISNSSHLQRTFRDKICFDLGCPVLNGKLCDVVIKILKHGIEVGQIRKYIVGYSNC